MKQVTIQFVDDIDGTVLRDGDGRTVQFSVDGDDYEIDLSTANEQALRRALDPYVSAARKSSRSSRRAKLKTESAEPSGVVRQWAIENGMDLPARGRIPHSVVEAYRAAH